MPAHYLHPYDQLFIIGSKLKRLYAHQLVKIMSFAHIVVLYLLCCSFYFSPLSHFIFVYLYGHTNVLRGFIHTRLSAHRKLRYSRPQ